jgi:GT2 family glycosyltransferase
MERVMSSSLDADRAIQFFALMQDDDILPIHDAWAERATDYFKLFPKLCVLGGYVAWNSVGPHGIPAEVEFTSNEFSYNLRNFRTLIPTRCKKHPFMFTQAIASSPMIVRRSCVAEIGPLSALATAPGEPGILFDIEYSLRAWEKGWQVGLYRTEFTHGVGGHGSTATPEKQAARTKVEAGALDYVSRNRMLPARCEYEYGPAAS